jgi:hypothetical protein
VTVTSFFKALVLFLACNEQHDLNPNYDEKCRSCPLNRVVIDTEAKFGSYTACDVLGYTMEAFTDD